MTAADLIALAKKQALGTACLVVALVCGGFLYFRGDAVTEQQTLLAAKSAEAGKMLANVKSAPGLEEQVAEIQQLGKELDSRLIRSSQLAVNLQYFYKLEAETGVKMLDVRQNNPSRPARGAAVANTLFTPVGFSLSVQGSHAKLVKFLGELQNGRHICRINNATFVKANTTGTADVPEEAEMTLSLTLDLLGQS